MIRKGWKEKKKKTKGYHDQTVMVMARTMYSKDSVFYIMVLFFFSYVLVV
jgi:hypothetical protein